MARPHHLDAHFSGALHHRVEIIHLEPQQHTIAVRSIRAIADRAVMMFDFKTMQLQYEPAIFHQLLVLSAAVSPAATQQMLIPPAAGFHIRYTDKWLWAHDSYLDGTPAFTSRRKDTSDAAREAVAISEGVRQLADLWRVTVVVVVVVVVVAAQIPPSSLRSEASIGSP
jgi:hypothetical protein